MEMIERCINENARVALDQNEYEARYVCEIPRLSLPAKAGNFISIFSIKCFSVTAISQFHYSLVL